jgi:hypothetical protein
MCRFFCPIESGSDDNENDLEREYEASDSDDISFCDARSDVDDIEYLCEVHEEEKPESEQIERKEDDDKVADGVADGIADEEMERDDLHPQIGQKRDRIEDDASISSHSSSSLGVRESEKSGENGKEMFSRDEDRTLLILIADRKSVEEVLERNVLPNRDEGSIRKRYKELISIIPTL